MGDHPGALCWCGHIRANHQDRHRNPPDACRADDCPCTTFRLDADPIAAGQLTEVIVGMTVTIRGPLGDLHGRVDRVEHDTTHTAVWLDNGAGIVLHSHLPITIGIDWAQDELPE